MCHGGWQNDWRRKGRRALRCKMGGITRSIQRTQWKSNPGDIWDPRRYEPTIAIYMDKLIQNGVLYAYRRWRTTIRNEAPSRERQSDMNYREIVAMSFLRVRRSVYPIFSRLVSVFFRVSMHTSRKSPVSVFNTVVVRYEYAWLFEELHYADKSKKNRQLTKFNCRLVK